MENNVVRQVNGLGVDYGWRRKTGCETHSQVAKSSLEFLVVEWKLRGLLPTLACPRIPAVTSDYFAAARSGETTDAGPFLKLNRKPDMVLFRSGAGISNRP